MRPRRRVCGANRLGNGGGLRTESSLGEHLLLFRRTRGGAISPGCVLHPPYLALPVLPKLPKNGFLHNVLPIFYVHHRNWLLP